MKKDSIRLKGVSYIPNDYNNSVSLYKRLVCKVVLYIVNQEEGDE